MPKGLTTKTKEYKTKASPKELSRWQGARQKRNSIDTESDKWYAVRRCAQGITYAQIAKELSEQNPSYSLSGEQVRLDVQATMIEWKRQNMENIEAYVAKELIRIDQIEEIVRKNFEQSCRDIRPREYSELMKRGLSADEIDEMFKDRPHAGDPRYLDTLLHLQMQRMRLLGIEKGSDVPKQTVVNYQFNNIGDEALSKMADLLQDNKYTELADEQ